MMQKEVKEEICEAFPDVEVKVDDDLMVVGEMESAIRENNWKTVVDAHNLRQKDGARLLGVNESAFSQVMSGRRRITMPLAKRLHSQLGISADMILEYA